MHMQVLLTVTHTDVLNARSTYFLFIIVNNVAGATNSSYKGTRVKTSADPFLMSSPKEIHSTKQAILLQLLTHAV